MSLATIVTRRRAPELGAHALLEQAAEIQLGEAHVAVARRARPAPSSRGSSLSISPSARMATPCSRPWARRLMMRPPGRRPDAVEADAARPNSSRDHGEGRARRAADAEREVPGVAAHHRHEEPALGGRGVLHQVAHQLSPSVARGLEAEGRRCGAAGAGRCRSSWARARRARRPAQRRGRAATRRERGVVAADRQQVRRRSRRLRVVGHRRAASGVVRRVGARGAEDRAAVEVDARDVVDLQLDDVRGVALDQPLEAVAAAEHAQPVVARLDGGGRDHRVDAGGRTAADENRQRLHTPTIMHLRSRCPSVPTSPLRAAQAA